jgi:hypothetical protein
MNLSRCRKNHTLGGRVTSMKCSVPNCPVRYRLVTNLCPGDGESPFRLEKLEDVVHNHQVAVEANRGMTDAQKAVVILCIERGQSSPKKVTRQRKKNF